jgi:hypothetical protein
LIDKKLSIDGETREALVVFFTLKIAYQLSSLKNICSYMNFLKNILLDRANGVLTAEYENWLQLYETSLKIYSRFEEVRVHNWL